MSEHVHKMECYEILLNCGRTPHTHSASCWDSAGLPKCLLGEHSHSSACNGRVLCCGK